MKPAEAGHRAAGPEGLTWYAAQADPQPPRPPLSGTRYCDVCVVGGGFAGLSTAYHLAARGYETIVLEADRVGAGASGRNSGFVLPGYAMEIDDLFRTLGASRAELLWRLSVEAVRMVATLIERHRIACDLKSGALTAATSIGDLRTFEAQARLMRACGYARLTLLDRVGVRDIVAAPRYCGGLLDDGAPPSRKARRSTRKARSRPSSTASICARSRRKAWSKPTMSCWRRVPISVRSRHGSRVAFYR
jgi:hypothetical protein